MLWTPVKGTIDDLPQLCDLLAELFAQESDFTADRETQAAGLRLILEDSKRGLVFVLRHEGMAVGMISLLFTLSVFQGGVVVWLEDLIVHRSFRESGAGTALLGHAIAFSNSINAKRINLLTDPWNQVAIRLYQKHGFVPSNLNAVRRHARID